MRAVGQGRAVLACVLTLPLAACGTSDRERDSAAVAHRFHAALESRDGRAACGELSEDTVSKLELQEQKPCSAAILRLQLPKGGTVAVRRVEMRSALAGLAGGSANFLNEGPDGWKVSGAGCRPTAPDQPYECELGG